LKFSDPSLNPKVEPAIILAAAAMNQIATSALAVANRNLFCLILHLAVWYVLLPFITGQTLPFIVTTFRTYY
jgi:hypothetical protein